MTNYYDTYGIFERIDYQKWKLLSYEDKILAIADCIQDSENNVFYGYNDTTEIINVDIQSAKYNLFNEYIAQINDLTQQLEDCQNSNNDLTVTSELTSNYIRFKLLKNNCYFDSTPVSSGTINKILSYYRQYDTSNGTVNSEGIKGLYTLNNKYNIIQPSAYSFNIRLWLYPVASRYIVTVGGLQLQCSSTSCSVVYNGASVFNVISYNASQWVYLQLIRQSGVTKCYKNGLLVSQHNNTTNLSSGTITCDVTGNNVVNLLEVDMNNSVEIVTTPPIRE